MNEAEQDIAEKVYAAMMVASNSTERAEQDRQFKIGVSNIGHCLSGDTEVPTSRGVVPIASLSGRTASLLVPGRSGSTIGHRATWREVEVREFGIQPLFKITMSRPGGSQRIVYATAEHQWYTTRESRDRGYSITSTIDLRDGDRMKEARASNPLTMVIIPAAAVMGFIHADGSRRHSDSEVTISHRGNKVASEMIPLLRAFSSQEKDTSNGSRYRGFPRSWKDVPDFSRETPAFALSWLAGYFAGDGSVGARGDCSIQSSSRASIEAVRFAAVLSGVSTSPVRTRTMRGGFGLTPNQERTVFKIGLRRRTVPDWFFLNAHHQARVRGLAAQARRSDAWVVRSVEPTDRIEPVYCAIVPGEEAFLLTEDLVTHNCSELVRRMLAGIEPTGEQDWLAAIVGTALGDWIETNAVPLVWPDAITQSEVVVRLETDMGTFNIPGHPDIVVPSEGLVLDNKTVNGLEFVRRNGPKQQQRWQRMLYAKAAHEAGMFPNHDLSEIRVGNIWADRSAAEHALHVQIEPYSEEVIAEAAEWVAEVVYAYLNGQETRKEPHYAFCESWCSYFEDCRMGETDVEGLITDIEIKTAIQVLQEAKELESRAKRMKNQAQVALNGVQGSTGEYTVRWVTVNGGTVSYNREPYLRLDVRAVKRPKEKA